MDLGWILATFAFFAISGMETNLISQLQGED